MSKKKYLTTPIFYANSAPHVGHLYTCLIADVWKKFNKINGLQVTLTSGMDEHGQKVNQAAYNKGLSPKEYVEEVNYIFWEFLSNYSFKCENWLRTSVSEEHEKAVQHIWNILDKKGYIYKSKYEGWYSISDEHYLDVGPDFVSNNEKIVWRSEECYYFKLSAFQSALLSFYEKNKYIIYPNKRYNEVIGILTTSELKDFAISRPKERLKWGIDVPGDDSQVIYVWIDALVSYLSSIGYPDSKYLNYWPPTHILGKDILKFHTIYWVALLMACDLPIPEKFIIHGWWLNDDNKISKSLNNAIDIEGLSNTYGYDSVRYYLLNHMKIGEDANFSSEHFKDSIVSVLSNRYGNLLLRILGIAQIKRLTELSGELKPEFNVFILNIKKKCSSFLDKIEDLDIYLSAFTELLDFLNNYIQQNKIWTLNGEELKAELYSLIYCFYFISIYYYPLLPDTSKNILKYFNETDISEDSITLELLQNQVFIISENLVLFPKMI